MSTIYGNAIIIPSVEGGTPVSVQNTKAVTITSNGTVSVTPDAPYDAMKKVNVTVDVASGGSSGETASVDVYGGSSDIDNVPISCIWQTEDGWMGTNEFYVTNNDYLFSIGGVLVGGYIIFTKDPTNPAFFRVDDRYGVEALSVYPPPDSSITLNASIVIKVIEPSCSFRLSVNVV